MIGFTALVLLSLATCVQFFNMQRDELIRSRAASGSYLLNEYRGQQDKLRSEAGKSEFSKPNPDGTMKIETVSFVPLADARAKVLQNPALLKAGPPPPGWIHPDDLAAGGAKAATPAATAPTPAPAPAPAPTASGTAHSGATTVAPVAVPAPADAKTH